MTRESLEQFARTTIARGGIHPDDIPRLLTMAPAGLAVMCWRNTALEDFHADPDSRISDGRMMQLNVRATRIFHEALTTHIADCTDGEPYCEDTFTASVLSNLRNDTLSQIFDPLAVLETGETLRSVFGEGGQDLLHQMHMAAIDEIGVLIADAELGDEHRALLITAFYAIAYARNWWSMPLWPAIVEAFIDVLDDPDHEHWSVGGYPKTLPARLDSLPMLRRQLLMGPDRMHESVLDFCTGPAMLRYVRI